MQNRQPIKPTYKNNTLQYEKFYWDGHEHLDEVGLIDMNGRMYDPLIARFLSPDPFVQTPSDPQNFNRYSYCLNNPLKYTDPSGDFVVFAAILGGTLNVIFQGAGGHINSFSDMFVSAGIGALSSFVGGYAGGAVFSALGSASSLGGAIGYGALSGAVGGAVSGALTGGGNALMNDGDFGKGVWQGALYGAASGALFGGIVNGVRFHTFVKGCNSLGFEQNGSVPTTDEMLLRAQKAWYPKAPMNQINDFSVENIEEHIESMIENGALAKTVPERITNPKGLIVLSGRSSVYFNPAAFENARHLYYTMGHEFVHVSQINAMIGYSTIPTDLMEYWAYDFQNNIGGGDLIGSQTRMDIKYNYSYNYYGSPDMESLNWTHFNWVNEVRFVYPF